MEKRFIFRGNAVGAAAHIHRPEDLIIWVQGASSLPVIGGYSRSTAGAATFGDVLSLKSVRTQATGDFSDKENAYSTLANAVVKGLNVNGRLTADSLEATLHASDPGDGSEPSISATDTEIINLRLDGYPISVTIDKDLCDRYVTREALIRAYKKKSGKGRIPEAGGYIVTSIVSEIRTKHPKAKVDGNVIILNGFGRIFLGELLITGNSRRLTLLRLKLGSPIEGDVACAEVETNGIILI
jgi:hypothetical protein